MIAPASTVLANTPEMELLLDQISAIGGILERMPQQLIEEDLIPTLQEKRHAYMERAETPRRDMVAALYGEGLGK